MFKEKLIKILKTDQIKDENLKYYSTKYPNWYEYPLNPTFDKIGLFEYRRPLELHPYYQFDQSLIDLAKEYHGKPIKKQSPELDWIVLEYLKSQQKMVMITIWEKITWQKKLIIDFLNRHGNLCYLRHLTLSDKAAINLIYQLYAYTSMYKDIESIKTKIYQICEWSRGGSKTITILVYENRDFDGQPAILQSKLNQLIDKKNRLLDKVYISKTFNQTVEQAEIYLNQNSLDFLESQLLDNHLSYPMRKSRIFIQTFKNWLSQEISSLDRERYLLFSSAILYVYGIRNCNDLDIYLDNNHNNLQPELEPKFFFADVSCMHTKNWKTHWDQWMPIWANKFGASDFHQAVYDPKYHFYYMGLKLLILRGDIERRAVRERPRAVADLIKIRELLDHPIEIPKMPTKQRKFIHIENGKIEDYPELEQIPSDQIIIKRYEIEYQIPIDKSRFLNTVQWSLKTRYRDEREIEELEGILSPKVVKKVKIRIKNCSQRGSKKN